ncbi:MAG: TetR/AcrR family transcriptional regulator [Lachnospiraceae bacterium]|nr:TetR/AcrR family transcriptional regulator [Lachnospiraceae bacterium]
MSNRKEFSPKEIAIFQAVLELFREGADISHLTVAEITGKAGIGKGTAYEYFSDKDEMIAKAIFYHAEQFCLSLYEQMLGEKSVYDRILLVLKRIETEIAEANCTFRLIQASCNKTGLGQKIQGMEELKSVYGLKPDEIFDRIIGSDFGTAVSLSEYEQEYLMLAIISKLCGYGIYLQKNMDLQPAKKEAMREMFCAGICREIEDALV